MAYHYFQFKFFKTIQFTEATDKVADFKKSNVGGSTVRRKLYNTQSGTTVPITPTSAKKATTQQSRRCKRNEEGGRTVVMTEESLRDLQPTNRLVTSAPSFRFEQRETMRRRRFNFRYVSPSFSISAAIKNFLLYIPI